MSIAQTSQLSGAVAADAGPAPQRRDHTSWLILALLLIWLAATLFPFVLAAINAIKTPSDYAEHGALGFPRTFDLNAITSFWVNAGFLQKLINSLMMSAGVAILAVAISLLNAYAIGIGRIKGGYTLLLILLMTIMAPQEALIYPLYYMLKWVGLFDNLYALIVIIAVLMSAFGTYLLASVMSTFPREIIH